MRIIVLVSALLMSSSALAQKDWVECPQEPKFLRRYPGAVITECSFRDYDEREMEIAEGKTKKVEGEVTRISYEVNDAQGTVVTSLQLFRNYETALKQGDFTILYSDANVITSQLKKGAQETWLRVSTSDGEVGLTMVRVKTMDQHVAVVDAVGFLEQLNSKGSVAVYGINFETAKATITPDSAKVLGEILKLLKQNPTLELLIEGHTDNVGGLRANLDLSQRRAAAVKEWLAKNGCDGKRLVTNGVGDRIPVAGNDTEKGKAKNRRVELVKL